MVKCIFHTISFVSSLVSGIFSLIVVFRLSLSGRVSSHLGMHLLACTCLDLLTLSFFFLLAPLLPPFSIYTSGSARILIPEVLFRSCSLLVPLHSCSHDIVHWCLSHPDIFVGSFYSLYVLMLILPMVSIFHRLYSVLVRSHLYLLALHSPVL